MTNELKALIAARFNAEPIGDDYIFTREDGATVKVIPTAPEVETDIMIIQAADGTRSIYIPVELSEEDLIHYLQPVIAL